jgi:hypothetical protein
MAFLEEDPELAQNYLYSISKSPHSISPIGREVAQAEIDYITRFPAVQ